MWENNEINFGHAEFEESIEQLGGAGEQTNEYVDDDLSRDARTKDLDVEIMRCTLELCLPRKRLQNEVRHGLRTEPCRT